MSSRSLRKALLVAVLLVGAGLRLWTLDANGPVATAPEVERAPATETRTPSGVEAVRRAFAGGRSGVQVELEARVLRVLDDDDDGDRHQRFVLRVDDEHTLLVAHNIDVAPRVPLAVGDTVTVAGQYEWNDRGGVLHWTHHDPDGSRVGGFVRHAGLVYE